MRKDLGLSRAFLWLALALPMLAVAACSPVDTAGIRFDIPAQPAAPALNEFARQADITLIFSYDLVANDRTRALKGQYTVDRGLTMLLGGTRLAYQRASDGTYLICPRGGCIPASGPRRQTSSTDSIEKPGRSSGNASAARLHD